MAVQVSRTDITCDSILDINHDPRRFLKIPIDKYLDLLGIVPIPSQIGLINAVNNPKYRFICAALSRRQGKTYIANIIGQLVTLVPGSQVLIMSPNYSLSQISFELQRSLIKHFELEVTKDNAKDKVIMLENGSTIRMGSINQVDSCVGRSYDLIIFDEAALGNGEDAFNVALMPTLDKTNSKVIFISTPRGRNNWFSKFYERGFSDEFPNWISLKATWKDNPRADEEAVMQAKKAMTEAEFNQEYLADFNVFEGQIWKFDAEKCTQDLSDFEFTSSIDVIAGLDIGFRDPTVMCIIAYCWDREMYYVLEDYSNREKTTADQAIAIKKLMDKYGVDFAFIDSAAQQTKYDFAQTYDIATTNSLKSVKDGIGFVGSLTENNKLIVDSRCKHVLYSLDQYKWDPNPNLLQEKPAHDDACHMADAIRYALYSYQTGISGF